LGVFEQDIPAKLCLEVFFSLFSICGWIAG
jgi:hypothetical protein